MVVVNADWHFQFNYILCKSIITIEILAVYGIWKLASYKIVVIAYYVLHHIITDYTSNNPLLHYLHL